jgi:O-antigen/teichoic acid export membrane protein
MLVGNLFSCVVSGIALRGALIGRFSMPELRRMFAYGLPLVPTAIALWGVSVLDRSLLYKLAAGNYQARAAVVGEYALANRFSSIAMFCVTAFLLAYGPFQLTLWAEDPELEKRVRGRMLTYVAVGLTAVALVLALFAREVAELVSPSYPTAYEAVGLLTMSVAVFGVSNIALAGISLTRRTGYIAIYTGASLILNAVMNVLLIPVWGMIGSAVATLAAYVLLAILYYWRSQILYPTPYSPRRVVIVLVLGQGAALVGLIRFSALGVGVGVKIGTLVAFAVALVALRVIDEADVAGLRELVTHALGRGRGTVAPAAAEVLEEPAAHGRG